MAVEVADTLTAKNNGTFPVVEDTAIAGGFQVVANASARAALIGSQKAKVGMVVVDSSDGKSYQLKASDEPDGDPHWVEYSSGSGLGQYVEDSENGDYIIV